MVSHTFWSDFEFDWIQKAPRDRFEKCRLPYLHIMLIMPVVKGEAFNACWLDKSSLQPNLNTGGQRRGNQARAERGGRRVFRFTNIQICRSWVKSFSLRENRFFPGRIPMRSREQDGCRICLIVSIQMWL